MLGQVPDLTSEPAKSAPDCARPNADARHLVHRPLPALASAATYAETVNEQVNADPSVFDDVQYVALTTFRKTGVGVPTAVWIARDGDELVVTTIDKSGKVKRLANNPAVELRPCDMRGNVVDGAPTYSGTAHVVRDAAGIGAVKRAVARKYPLARVGDAANKLTFGLLQRSPRAGIRITLT